MRLRQFQLLMGICFALACGRAAKAEGPGVRLGDQLVLHPGIGFEVRWDSNIFYQTQNPVSAFLLRLTPRIDLATRPPQRGGNTPHMLDFRLHAGLDYREYLTSEASIRRHREFNVEAGVIASINPQGQVALDLFDNYVRFTQPPYSNVSYNLNRDVNDLGARLRIRPSGGRLEVGASYIFGVDFWENSQGNINDFNLFSHFFQLRGSWKFFPKTAVYLQLDETLYTYLDSKVFLHPNSYPFRAIAGLNGLITPKLTLNAWIGYGNGFYVTGPSPNTAIGGVELRWKPTLLSTGTIGYRHDFINSLLGSFYNFDAVYIGWNEQIWRFNLGLRAQYQNNRYEGIMPITGNASPSGTFSSTGTDNVFNLGARVDYAIRDWVFIGAGYDLNLLRTDRVLRSINLTIPGLFPVDFTKHVVWLQLALLY